MLYVIYTTRKKERLKFHMGLFDFIKKNFQTVLSSEVLDAQVIQDDNLEHLTKDGELPWGWIYRNKEFTDKINKEYTYYLHAWLDSRKKSPKELQVVLTSFIVYLEDTEKLCKSKGECFEFWFYNILVSDDYIDRRKEELHQLKANLEELQNNYVKRNEELSDIDERIIKKLKEHRIILQSDFVKMFDPLIQDYVREKLYYMEKENVLDRIKSGRTYTLRYKG